MVHKSDMNGYSIDDYRNSRCSSNASIFDQKKQLKEDECIIRSDEDNKSDNTLLIQLSLNNTSNHNKKNSDDEKSDYENEEHNDEDNLEDEDENTKSHDGEDNEEREDSLEHDDENENDGENNEEREESLEHENENDDDEIEDNEDNENNEDDENSENNKDEAEKSKNKQIIKPKIKLTLSSIRVVALWNYNTENTDCTLCHRDLMSSIPIEDINKSINRNRCDNDVIIGTCKHGYHSTCIRSWLKHGNVTCPKCQSMWKTNKNVSSGVLCYDQSV